VSRAVDLVSRRAIQQLEAERDLLEGLLLRMPSLVAELDTERLVHGIAEATCEFTAARFAAFVPADGDHQGVIFTGLGPDAFAEPPAFGQAPLLSGVQWPGETLRIDDVSAWTRLDETRRSYGVLADGNPVRSWLAAPVRRRGGALLGALYLGHDRSHAFSIRHERLVGGLCAQLGMAIENATVFAERSRVAAALQQTLLPPLLPTVPGVDLAARYRPTGAGNLVGGDFYDVFELGDETWGLVLGDVSGFGPEAAALTGLARYTIRACARHDRPPWAILAELNEAMLRQDLQERFCTAIYARVRRDGDKIEAVLANGGHPPGAVLRDDGSVELLEGQPGLLLGAFPEPALHDRQVILSPGEALVLYTDGVVEARDRAGEQFGEERLLELVGTCAGRSADGIARRVELAVLDHQADETLDDIAIVVLRARP
jgi:serine phosphatase RsbU (regulator of sigma subunit)